VTELPPRVAEKLTVPVGFVPVIVAVTVSEDPTVGEAEKVTAVEVDLLATVIPMLVAVVSVSE
jgi:hypothetical protein